MLNRYFEFNESSRELILYDDNLNKIETYAIGENLINFLEIDFSDYTAFYNDLSQIYKTECSTRSDEDVQWKEFLDLDYISEFFVKYPLLKQIVINKAINIAKSLDHVKIPFDIDCSIFDKTFENLHMYRDITEDYFFENPEYLEIDLHIHIILTHFHDFNELTWDFIYKENPYIKNITEIQNNLYVRLVYDEDCDESIIHRLCFHDIQDPYLEAFTFCFDSDLNSKLSNLTSSERFSLFNYIYPYNHIAFDAVRTTFLTKKSSKYKFPEYHDLVIKDKLLNWANTIINQKIVNESLKEDNTIKQVYETNNLNDIILIEFQKMIACNIKAKKCSNCDKYFILKGEYNTKYCDRIPEGERYTCQKIAALKKQRRKLENSPILREYQRAYKRNYARLSNKKMQPEEFRIWVERSTIKRDQLTEEFKENPSGAILEEFKKYLGNK